MVTGCAFIAGLPIEVACAVGVIGVVITAIALGILGKMAYNTVSRKADEGKSEDIESILSDMRHERLGTQEMGTTVG